MKEKTYLITAQYQIKVCCNSAKFAKEIVEERPPFIRGCGSSTKNGGYDYKDTGEVKIISCEVVK